MSAPASSRPNDRTPSALQAALDGSTPLASLLARLRESERRWSQVRPALPATLAETVHAGTLDDDGWTLVAEHASAAAKLRQYAPIIDQLLAEAGWRVLPLKIKVRPRG